MELLWCLDPLCEDRPTYKKKEKERGVGGREEVEERKEETKTNALAHFASFLFLLVFNRAKVLLSLLFLARSSSPTPPNEQCSSARRSAACATSTCSLRAGWPQAAAAERQEGSRLVRCGGKKKVMTTAARWKSLSFFVFCRFELARRNGTRALLSTKAHERTLSLS